MTDKEFRADHYGSNPFVRYPLDDDHFRLLVSFANLTRIRTSMEVGISSGAFLAMLGECSFEFSGIDVHPRNATGLPRWLASQGFSVGEFRSGDFRSASIQTQFDLVYSVGFVEHFTDLDEVILRHAEMVGPGGYLFITTPNFRGFVQRWLHQFLDKENPGRHHLPSKDPQLWAKMPRGNGFDVLFAGHFGGLAFWVDATAKRSRAWSAIATFVARLFWNLKKVYKRDSEHFSAHCGLIAVRRAAP